MQFDHPFFGYLALTLEPVEKPDMDPPTMATDGIHLYYHPDFVKNTPLSELTGVIAHEIGHIILKHIFREQGREHQRWNIACDYAVNYLILKEFKLPRGCLQDPAFFDKDAEWIYSHLDLSEDENQVTLDSHSEWSNSKSKDGKNDTQKDGDADNSLISTDLEQEWQNRVAVAASQARIKGNLPAHLESVIDNLLQPKLDWKTLLRDRITSCAKNDFVLNPCNKKHLYRGFYLPGIAGEEINIAVGVDTSGSISDEDIRMFLSEIKGICDSYDEYTIHLFFADADIQARYELRPFDPLPKIIAGRGGTDFRPVMEEVSKLDITALVYFTDMYGSFPDKEPNYNVIWVSTTEGYEAPWGAMVEYPTDERKRRRRRR